MYKLLLAAGTAALAISAPVGAAPDGKGRDKDRGAKVERTAERGKAREARAERVSARQDRARDRAQRVEVRENRAERIKDRGDRRDLRGAQVERMQARDERMKSRDMRADRAQAREERVRVREARDRAQSIRMERRADRIDRRAERMDRRLQARDDRRFRQESNARVRWTNANVRGGLIDGCPPGLYMKNNGCLPPGQAKKLVGTRVPQSFASYSVPAPIAYLYPDTPSYTYRYNDGYLYQIDRKTNLIEALIPLIAGGLLPGQTLPMSYASNNFPRYYNGFYPDYGGQCSHYANGVVYYTDCATGLIENIVPVYDRGYGVGQLLPAGYGYYNLPMQYRDVYYDRGNTGYWYAPGAIYQYDPQTQLISSIAALLSPGLTIGQPLPAGYGAYNVPLGFRDTYYDTPTSMYRYANGNIYQVDPVTQLVTAIVASVLT